MQAKTFNRLVIVTMVVAAILPLLVWFIDSQTKQSGMFPNLIGALALYTIPPLWLLGNVLTGFVAYFNRTLINRLFWAQCVVSGFILIAVIYWAISEQFRLNQLDLRQQVVKSIITGNKTKYKQALNECGDVCKNQDKTDSVNYLNQYDEYAYKDWLLSAVAAQAGEIVDDLLIDPKRPSIALVGSGAPYLSLNDSCRGYYVGNADVYQIAVLQKTPAILQRLITNARADDKSTALWYAARANRIDYVQRLLAAGANRNIKDEYGVIGLEDAGYSLLDAAIEGFAPETLQWLLANGFAPNGPLGQSVNGKNETPVLKHTPLHTLVYMAQQEQRQFKSLTGSIEMWQMLKKAGADDAIAKPQSNGTTQTPLQSLLQSNVFEDSAVVVQAFVALNISQLALMPQDKAKLQLFLDMKVKQEKIKRMPNDDEYCAENWLRQNYNLAY